MDEIQRKLALIDKQLAGGPVNRYRHLIATCPLLFPVIGLILGILIQQALSVSGVPGHARQHIRLWLIVMAVCSLMAVLILVVRKSTGAHVPALLSFLALVCAMCLGGIRLISFQRLDSDDLCHLVGDERKLATIRGLIVTEPRRENREWHFAKFTYSDPSSSFYLRIDEVESTSGWAKASGMVRVWVGGAVIDLTVGDRIEACCWLDRFKPATNPGQFDVSQHVRRRNTLVAASVESRDGIRLLPSRSTGIFTDIRTRVRQTAANALLGDLPSDDASQGLLQALLLGARHDIDATTYLAFRRTGLLHFISLSGMHLGILVAIIWWLCKTAGLLKPARATVCMIAVATFLLIVPPRAPTLRAAIICWVYCASILTRRNPSSLNTLSLAAIILLLIRPTQLFEAGWQLSFSSVLALVLLCRRIHSFLYEKIAGLSLHGKVPRAKTLFRIVWRPGAYLLTLFSTGLTAWLGGAGILLYHFYTINPFTSIWTVLVFPLVGAILTLGFLKMILHFVLPTVAAALGLVASVLSGSLIWLVKLIAELNISQILIGHVSLAPVVLYYCLVFFAAFVYIRRPLLKRAICTAMALGLIVLLGTTKWQRTYRDSLFLTCLDVGHGQAILAQLPGRTNILFDAGSLYKSDVGRRIVAPFLDYSGIGKIHAVVISHNDIDHISGIPEVTEYCDIGVIYANDAFFDATDAWGTASHLNEYLNRKGLGIQRLGETLNMDSEAYVKMLWPRGNTHQYEQLSDNDRSLVTFIEFADTKVLLCSDIEQFAQRELLRLHPDLRADVVVAPHHGSAATRDPDFLPSLNARTLICSCGRGQYENQPTITPANETESFFTARDGAVIARIDRDGRITTHTFAKTSGRE
ncbi:MAG: ComEC/Rec2 family competence protein [Phycisphaerales bacterium]|nr:MAG: ComEC/Rec2 family competence protein [Phycisphaerales bacterium]